MQRPPYHQATSPPLHHPVPQHVSTVPQLRSPPPPVSSQNSGHEYGYGGQQQQGQGQQGQQSQAHGNFSGYPPFGGFINDSTAQMGLAVGQQAFAAGQAAVERELKGWGVNVSALKHYFNVTNAYVLRKIYLVLFPWRHRPWSRQQRLNHSSNSNETFYLPPREDVNSPDMYIPVMSITTYTLLSPLLAGLHGQFDPKLLGGTAFIAMALIALEIAGLKFGTYVLGISSESQLLDLIAYSGYKFVGVIITLITSEILTGGKGTGGWIGWAVFLYTWLALAFFLLRSLKYVLLPSDNTNPGASGASGSYTVARSQRNRRTQVLFVYAYVVQFLFMWILTR